MKNYDGVLLDADNTLFDYDRAEAEALEETLADVAPDSPRARARETYHVINAGYWRRFEAGEIDAAGLRLGRWADTFRALGLRADPARASVDYVSRLASKAHLLPGAAAVVVELARRARLGLVTNGLSTVQRGRLAASGIEEHFAAVLISEEIGMAKPDPRFFLAAAKALGLPPVRLLCVGDNPSADVAGARSAGIDACWFAPGGASWPGPGEPPMHIVRNLAELPAIVGGP
ncbi:MAG TPA: YjjG family noncanonical pyrimidine nucleotidase [Spirochaetia bacterium]|nr:YjjG family noncanonical pyrimidine nucleotidase [Spirochaetia bacterium]